MLHGRAISASLNTDINLDTEEKTSQTQNSKAYLKKK